MAFLLSVASLNCLAADPVFVNSYEEAVGFEDVPVLVIFGTKWCGSCNNLKNNMSKMNLDDYVVCVVDVEERKDLGAEYKVRSYPTSVVINNKKEISRKIGYKKNEFEKWVSQNRSK